MKNLRNSGRFKMNKKGNISLAPYRNYYRKHNNFCDWSQKTAYFHIKGFLMIMQSVIRVQKIKVSPKNGLTKNSGLDAIFTV